MPNDFCRRPMPPGGDDVSRLRQDPKKAGGGGQSWPEVNKWAIDTDLGRLDIVQGLDGVPSFGELRSRASTGRGCRYSVCTPSVRFGG